MLGARYFLHARSTQLNSSQAPVVVVHDIKPSAIPTKNVASPLKNQPVPTSASAKENVTEVVKLSAGDAVVSTEIQNHINDLFAQAERAIGMDRLTAPVEDNAYGYYQKILSLSPSNVAAKEGLDRVASRYMSKAQEQINLGNIQQGEALIQRARFVSERYVQAHEIAEVNTVNPIKSEPEFALNNGTSLAEKVPTESIKPFSVVEASTVSITPNAEWKDEQLAHHAHELIQQNKQPEALALLKNFIATEQKPVLSAALLADLYVQQENLQAAEIVMDKASYLPVDVKAKLSAQILSAKGSDAQAIAILEKNLSAAEANEGYRSMLAGLYHKTANYQQSIVSYQRLLNNFGEKPAYWLGLALAYDSLAQHKNALQAYLRLREFPQLQLQVKKYTDQRIAALSSE